MMTGLAIATLIVSILANVGIAFFALGWRAQLGAYQEDASRLPREMRAMSSEEIAETYTLKQLTNACKAYPGGRYDPGVPVRLESARQMRCAMDALEEEV